MLAMRMHDGWTQNIQTDFELSLPSAQNLNNYCTYIHLSTPDITIAILRFPEGNKIMKVLSLTQRISSLSFDKNVADRHSVAIFFRETL